MTVIQWHYVLLIAYAATSVFVYVCLHFFL